MSVPRNNLEDLLRKKAASTSTTNALSSNSQKSNALKSKFRAAPGPSTPVRSRTLPVVAHSSTAPAVPTSRPLSSTVRTAREKTPTLLRTPMDDVSVAISSEGSSPASLSTSTTSVPVKRTSPHPDLGSAHKRARSNGTFTEKENLSHAPFRDKGKAPVRHNFSLRMPLPTNTQATPTLSIQVPPPMTQTISEPQHGVAASTRLYAFDFSFLLVYTPKELQDFKEQVVDIRSKNVEMTSQLIKLGQRSAGSCSLQHKMDDIWKDAITFAEQLMKQHEAGEVLSLPISSTQSSTQLSIAPLQPSGTPSSPLSRSTNLPDGAHLSARHVQYESVPSERSTTTSSYEGTKYDAISGSDDVLWDDMDEPTMDELDGLSQASQLQSAIVPPPSSQPRLPAASTVASTSFVPLTVGAAYVLDSALLATPYYSELVKTLHDVFGLQAFRPNQLEAISACMENKDVFVLMPTGGGKSLCFQLPAVVKHRQRNTVTFVISPLISLMNDQVQALTSKGISVALLKGEQANNSGVFASLVDRRPGHRPCFVYVTPEFLEKSERLKDKLSQLAAENGIALFVVDEAHCIQTWGRSFRESYASLASLRKCYPTVPIMALTATANRLAERDIIDRLAIQGCQRLKMSFNRPNLTYTVVRKYSSTAVNDLLLWIKEEHCGHSGIVYCQSKKKCEKLAKKLGEGGIGATFYHADIDPLTKARVQEEWQSGEVKIIVATVAFGMGIDKSDVRFVVHIGLPTSLSNYYQETGRAGRDGKTADCRLYYDMHDSIWMIQRARKEAQNEEVAAAEIADIWSVVDYCKNDVDCRRQLVLAFFDERFDKANCKKTCDNCINDKLALEKDVSDAAQNLVRLVQQLNGKATRPALMELFVGKTTTALAKSLNQPRLTYKGSGKEYRKEEVVRIIEELQRLEVLSCEIRSTNVQWSNDYIILGPNGQNFLRRRPQLKLLYRQETSKGKKGKKRMVTQDEPDAEPGPSRNDRSREVEELPDDPIESCDANDDWSVYQQAYVSDDGGYQVDDDVVYVGIASDFHDTVSRRRDVTRNQEWTPPDIDSDVEIVETDSTSKPALSSDTCKACLAELLAHREKLAKEFEIDLSDIFDDQALYLISCVLPADKIDFIRQLDQFGVPARTSPNARFIPSFLEVLMPYRAAQSSTLTRTSAEPQAARSKPPSASQLHSRYEYRPGTSSSKPLSRQ